MYRALVLLARLACVGHALRLHMRKKLQQRSSKENHQRFREIGHAGSRVMHSDDLNTRVYLTGTAPFWASVMWHFARTALQTLRIPQAFSVQALFNPAHVPLRSSQSVVCHRMVLSGLAMSSISDKKALFDWIAGLPGGEIGPVAVKSSLVGSGCGMFTTREVEPLELLVAVPEEACLSLSTVRSSLSDIDVALLDDIENELDQVAMYLAHRRLCGGGDSPYLDSSALPWNAEDQEHILWWSNDELDLLSGCTVQTHANDLHTYVQWAIGRLMDVLPAKSRAEVDNALRGAYVSIMSRGFGFPEHWLVPVMDNCNHQTKYNSYFAHEQQGCAKVRYELRSQQRLAAGVEVTLNYGCHKDYVFCCNYGFLCSHEWSKSATFDVAGKSFDLDQYQVNYLLNEREDFTTAADWLSLEDLRSCAETCARKEECTVEDVLMRSVQLRIAALNRGLAVASEAAAKGVLPSRVAMADAMRESERGVLEDLVAYLSRYVST